MISLAARSTSTPLMSGIRMSDSSRSNGSVLERSTAFSPVFRQHDVVAVAAQHDLQHLAHRPFVVDDENARLAGRSRLCGPGVLDGAGADRL